MVYNINRKEECFAKPLYQSPVPKFPRHISYDLVLFGSWRRKGVTIGEGQMVASPETYPVLGFNFAPMYNFGYKFRAGISLDGVYDGSANVYSPDGYGDELLKPSAGKQLALGVSGRAEYVMPYFTVGIGFGYKCDSCRRRFKIFLPDIGTEDRSYAQLIPSYRI